MIAFKYSHWEKTFINIQVVVANQNGRDVSFFSREIYSFFHRKIINGTAGSLFNSVAFAQTFYFFQSCQIALVPPSPQADYSNPFFICCVSVIMHQCYASFLRLSYALKPENLQNSDPFISPKHSQLHTTVLLSKPIQTIQWLILSHSPFFIPLW